MAISPEQRCRLFAFSSVSSRLFLTSGLVRFLVTFAAALPKGPEGHESDEHHRRQHQHGLLEPDADHQKNTR